MDEMEGILAEYKHSLSELVFNSKPHISMLTVMAEENHNVAHEIVRIIVKRIHEASWNHKLPVLYLIDSIVKNFGGQYKKLFGQNLISVFLRVFEKVEVKTKQDLFKLRQTWEPVFSRSLLQKLDEAVHAIDRHWPVFAQGHKKSRRKSENNPKFQVSPSTSTSHSNKSDTAEYKDGEVEVDEEELILDEVGYEQLAELEATLKAKQAELDGLETEEVKKVEPTSDEPLPVVQPEPENRRIHGLEDVPMIVTNGHAEPQFSPQVVLPAPALASEPGISPQIEHRNQHPPLDRIVGEETTTPPAASQVTSVQTYEHTALSPPAILSIVAALAAERSRLRVPSPPPPPVLERITTHASMQTATVETQDVAIQWKSRRKTKNFTNQFRAPSKSFGVMIRPRIREASTQVEAGDLPRNPDEDDKEDFDLWERNVDKSARNLHCRHALRMFHTFRRMLDDDDLCDVIVMVETQEFPAHKLVLSGSSDFFSDVFCNNPELSEISLEATPASIWKLVLNYFYSSRLEINQLNKTDIKALMITIQGLKMHTLYAVCAELGSALDLDGDMTGWYIQDERIIKPGEEPPTFDPNINGMVNGFGPAPQEPATPVEPPPRSPAEPDVPGYESDHVMNQILSSSSSTPLSSSSEDSSNGSKGDEILAVISKPKEVKAPVKEETIRLNKSKEEMRKRKRSSPPKSEKKETRRSSRPVLATTTTDSEDRRSVVKEKKVFTKTTSPRKKKKRPAAPLTSSSSSSSLYSSTDDEVPSKKQKVEEEHKYTCGQCGMRFTDVTHLSRCKKAMMKKTNKNDKPKKVKEKPDVAAPSDSSEGRRRKKESIEAADTSKSTLQRKSTPQSNKKSSSKPSEHLSHKKKPITPKPVKATTPKPIKTTASKPIKTTTPKPAAKQIPNGVVTVSKSNRSGTDVKNKPSVSATPAAKIVKPTVAAAGSPSAVYRFNCEVCGKGFGMQCVYKKHMNEHKPKN